MKRKKMPSGYWTEEKIKEEARLYKKRGHFSKEGRAAYKAAKKMGKSFFEEVCSHMDAPLTAAYEINEIEAEAKKYIKRGDFRKNSPKEYGFACDKGKIFLDSICGHMQPSKTEAYSEEEISLEAIKYTRRIDFMNGSNGAYQSAQKRGSKFFNELCRHMDAPLTEAYNDEELKEKASKYRRRVDFENKDGGAYVAACKKGKEFLNSICSHMNPSATEAYSLEEIVSKAKMYSCYSDFKRGHSGAYKAAKRMNVLGSVCLHMTKRGGTSMIEKEIFSYIELKYVNVKKIMDRKVYILGKPHIHGFEIDFFVPELNKGIEFDGTYHHSFKYMRMSKRKQEWSDEDIRNYHEIKDAWFLSKGIKILHIKEKDWILNKEDCIKRCLEFLASN